MKLAEFISKPWSLPLVVGIEAGAIIGGLWFLFSIVPGPINRPEQKTEIKSYSVESQAGQIQVTDLKSGTEFNRIMVLPNGRTVVEAGYINSWGEDRIRIIGDRVDP
jgi:hypothetical protein